MSKKLNGYQPTSKMPKNVKGPQGGTGETFMDKVIKKGKENRDKGDVLGSYTAAAEIWGNRQRILNGLELSDITITLKPAKREDTKTLADVKIILNKILVLKGLKIIDGITGIFLSYPPLPSDDDTNYSSAYYPLCKDFRETLEEMVLEEYYLLLRKGEKDG